MDIQRMKRSLKKKTKFDEMFDGRPEGPLRRAEKHAKFDRTLRERASKRLKTSEVSTDDNRTLTEQMRDLGIEQPFDVTDEYLERHVEEFDDHYPEPEVTAHIPSHLQEEYKAAHRPIVVFPTQET